MQSFPKIFETTALGTTSTPIAAAPSGSLIRLHKIEISIQNNNTVPIAGSVDIGINYYRVIGFSNLIYDTIFLPAVSIVTIPGNIIIKKDFGPLGVLCYPITANGQAILYSYISQNLGVSASFTSSYNYEPIGS